MTRKRVNTDKMTLICYTKYHIALSAAGVREKKTLSDAGKIMLFFPCGFPALLLLICLIYFASCSMAAASFRASSNIFSFSLSPSSICS